MIIAASGKKQVGKNTLCSFIADIYKDRGVANNDIYQLSFAAPLKSITHEMFPLVKPGAYYETYPCEKEQVIPQYGRTPRDIYINVGRDFRKLYPNVWVEDVMRQIDKIQDSGNPSIILISDCRFLNEISALSNLDAYIIRLYRDTKLPGDSADDALDSYNDWYAGYTNNGTFDELYGFAEHIVHVAKDSVKSLK